MAVPFPLLAALAALTAGAEPAATAPSAVVTTRDDDGATADDAADRSKPKPTPKPKPQPPPDYCPACGLG